MYIGTEPFGAELLELSPDLCIPHEVSSLTLQQVRIAVSSVLFAQDEDEFRNQFYDEESLMKSEQEIIYRINRQCGLNVVSNPTKLHEAVIEGLMNSNLFPENEDVDSASCDVVLEEKKLDFPVTLQKTIDSISKRLLKYCMISLR